MFDRLLARLGLCRQANVIEALLALKQAQARHDGVMHDRAMVEAVNMALGRTIQPSRTGLIEMER